MAGYPAAISLSSDHLTPVSPQGLGSSVTVKCLAGATVYYADSKIASASQNQGSLTAGQSATFTNPAWLASASHSDITVTYSDVVLPSPEEALSAEISAVEVDFAAPVTVFPARHSQRCSRSTRLLIQVSAVTLYFCCRTYYIWAAADGRTTVIARQSFNQPRRL